MAVAISEAHIKGARLSSIAAGILLALLAMTLFASVRQESGLGDETIHLFSGYEYWKHADFGRNPEHPPLAKLLAALPLLPMHLQEPPPLPLPFFKAQDAANSTQFLYSQDADSMLIRGRTVILIFSVGLGLLVFLAGREMFGPATGLLALGLFVFEPIVLANGALITTDMPLACLFFATVYAFYRYLQRRTWSQLALCAVACSLTITTKHSGILILPTLALLAIFDVMLVSPAIVGRSTTHKTSALRTVFQLSGAIAIIAVVSYAFLWTIYGFRFAARPGSLQMAPGFAVYAVGLTPLKHGLIDFAARHHLFPEAYLYGWVDILLLHLYQGSFVLGRFYNWGQWSYFPLLFLIKTTVALLVLLLLVPFTHLFKRRREALFLTLPAAFFALSSMSSMINLGVRHLLPIYPFCFVLAASAAAFFVQRYRFAWLGVGALLVLDIVSSLHVFPDYLAYANEFVGGPSHLYLLAADSNADWGQGLKWIKQYVDRNPTSDCWVSAESAPLVPAEYYVSRCKPLLNGVSRMIGQPVASLPRTISGTIFVGTTDITGFHWGPGKLNPYAAFRDGHPDTVLNNAIWVYHGTFDISLLAALNNALTGQNMLPSQPTAALVFAKTAAEQYPESADVQAVLAQALMATGQTSAGRDALAKALRLAQSNQAEYQQALIYQLEHLRSNP